MDIVAVESIHDVEGRAVPAFSFAVWSEQLAWTLASGIAKPIHRSEWGLPEENGLFSKLRCGRDVHVLMTKLDVAAEHREVRSNSIENVSYAEDTIVRLLWQTIGGMKYVNRLELVHSKTYIDNL